MQKHNIPNTIDGLNGAIGNEIGSGNIRYIQDIGQKLEGVPYLDKNTGRLYLCVAATATTDNNSNFIKLDLKELSQKLSTMTRVKFRKDNLSMAIGVNSLEIFTPSEFQQMQNHEVIYIAADGNNVGQMTLLVVPVYLLKDSRDMRPVAYITDYEGYNSTKAPFHYDVILQNGSLVVNKYQLGVESSLIPALYINTTFVL